MSNINQELFSFIKKSPTNYHAVATSIKLLEEQGFVPLYEQNPWHLTSGGKYYISRNQTSLFAFRIPEQVDPQDCTFQIIASHSDSPCFKLKGTPEITVDGHYTKLNVEKYGGALLAPWFDRPLSLAGRLVIREGDTLSSRLVAPDRDLAMIPNLAIHMNRSANDGYKYQIQTDMLPLIGGGSKDFSIRKLFADELGIAPEDILSFDLCVYNRMDGCVWGAENEFISCPRLDDLQCAFASIKALTGPCTSNIIPAAAIFDNEEVGSQSRQGASSTFLKDCLERISLTLGRTPEEHLQTIAGSFLLSADNGHALHPNYPAKADPVHHPYLNGGVLLKYAANQKYTSDGMTGGVFQALCDLWDIPCQVFYNHSDEPGGSPLGNLSMSQVSIPTVDIGVTLLAMHSPFETGGAEDTQALYNAMSAFYQTRLLLTREGGYQLVR